METNKINKELLKVAAAYIMSTGNMTKQAENGLVGGLLEMLFGGAKPQSPMDRMKAMFETYKSFADKLKWMRENPMFGTGITPTPTTPAATTAAPAATAPGFRTLYTRSAPR